MSVCPQSRNERENKNKQRKAYEIENLKGQDAKLKYAKTYTYSFY
jgi:hypothetical protein